MRAPSDPLDSGIACRAYPQPCSLTLSRSAFRVKGREGLRVRHAHRSVAGVGDLELHAGRDMAHLARPRQRLVRRRLRARTPASGQDRVLPAGATGDHTLTHPILSTATAVVCAPARCLQWCNMRQRSTSARHKGLVRSTPAPLLLAGADHVRPRRPRAPHSRVRCVTACQCAAPLPRKRGRDAAALLRDMPTDHAPSKCARRGWAATDCLTRSGAPRRRPRR